MDPSASWPAALFLFALSLTFVFLGATQLPGPPPPPRSYPPMRIRPSPPVVPVVAVSKHQQPHPPPFRFADLPAELQLLILGHCADSMRTYRALVLVSRQTHYTALRACIPLLPITLISSGELASFSSFLARRLRPASSTTHIDRADPPHLSPVPSRTRTSFPSGSLVARLWITPLSSTDEPIAQHILAACPHVRELACDAPTLTYALGLASRHRHPRLTRLTLLLTHRGWEHALATTPQGTKILSQLTHLRVMAAQLVPNADPSHHHHSHSHSHSHSHRDEAAGIRMRSLTHLSYFEPHHLPLTFPPPSPTSPTSPSRETSDERRKPDLATTPRALFPALAHTVVTRRWDPSTLTDPAPLPKRFGPGLVLFHAPRELTEMELWISAVRGKSMWDLAADAVPVDSEGRERV